VPSPHARFAGCCCCCDLSVCTCMGDVRRLRGFLHGSATCMPLFTASVAQHCSSSQLQLLPHCSLTYARADGGRPGTHPQVVRRPCSPAFPVLLHERLLRRKRMRDGDEVALTHGAGACALSAAM
jgi:hypothetical protein